MTNLPISSKQHPPGNAANALQAGIVADAQSTDTQSAGPFAFLLAQQIGETELPALTTAQATIVIDGNTANGSADHTLKDAQDQAAAATNIPVDPASTLAAMLQQLPAPDNRGQKTESMQANQPLAISPQKIDSQQAALSFAPGSFQKIDSQQANQALDLSSFQKTDGQQANQALDLSSFQKTDGQQVKQTLDLSSFQKTDSRQVPPPLTPGSFQKTDGQQVKQPFSLSSPQKADGPQATQPLDLSPLQKTDGQPQPFASDSSQETGRKSSTAGSEGSQIIQSLAIDHLPSEAVKPTELPSGNTPQAIASSAISAAMPGMLANNVSADTPPTIATPLGHNGWADEFSQKISWISKQQNQVAELHLNPPNLGPLDVTLTISDNQATALFTSPHGAVRDAVENALPKLREILADNGIMLGNTTVSDQPPRDRSMDGFMNQGSGTAARHEAFGSASEPAGLAPASAQTVPARRHNGMVDTFA